MIESKYWKDDLLKYAKKFQPVKKPPRYSEKRQVNFEKDVVISAFIVRKLSEIHALSASTIRKQFEVFSYRCTKPVNNRNYWDISELYDMDSEMKQTKNIQFISNQLIHGQAMYAYRDDSRNWHGVWACSDFERNKYVYRIPISTIINMLETAANDYPEQINYRYCSKKNDYIVETN
ncbi:TPA: hypothetical protein ACQYCV_001420 [Vibrio parahaemolyticus]|uniref:hypothetical protein n=1 Tax=Vibrio parahaemolyticus TaxID=670 RepID=UPI001DD4EF82|nr:hypothetical protein [Vibrio parahaemolyticus]EGQ8919483.1 hypothetical protein [Vibrio parahaemolyticus]EHH1101620.1 hypothetical protein [Vibrio parahaemolyticus]MCG9644978.1 hypothetical protein [Vibrio parahaemolyticus]HCE2382699.1 hypothetical protein [Vibrio parahaemolyticus]